jgi:hypothetical protein
MKSSSRDSDGTGNEGEGCKLFGGEFGIIIGSATEVGI